ncbi:Major facilitator superfamily transporter [Nitrosotalea devaniterrae]|uniref:Major facilitator superfamily transporter n=1 Tax=Nitrosotalea devaniterrae TaxID=1078905 RepID=A0A128A4D8_9ARCH|nr:Major facilitator superfamily transporter [Candidatus Nitrosotalea devanaterra]
MKSNTSPASENPLKNTMYRFLWVTMFASDIGASMQTAGSGWLMTSLAPSPFVVSLLQVMTSLSIFLLAFPAGALADIVDRRKLFLTTQYFSLAVAIALSLLTFGGVTTSSILVVFTLLLGLGNAMSLPANLVIQTEIVPKKIALAAMTLFSVAIYIGFAVGPVLGGLVVAAAGPGMVFLLNAFSFVGIIIFLHKWHKPSESKPLPPEQVIGAIRTGLRYMRHSLHVRALLVRDFAITICGSAAISLLPLLARNEAGSNSILFGVLVGALGIGGLISGFVIVPRIKSISIEKRVAGATILYAVAMIVISFHHGLVILFVGIFAIGTSLIIITSSLNFVAYNSVSSWVRTRVVSVHQMMYWGGVAFGSIVWGIVAEIWGIPTALIAAAIGLVIGLVTSTRYKLKPLTDVDLTPSMHWYMPRVMIDIDDHAQGSVLVEMEFEIDPTRSQEFESAMNDMRSVILRDGAINWELFHDVENPSRYVMMFTSESWTEHLRHHERMTKADLATEQRAISFHIGKIPPRISHLVSEDMSKQNNKIKNENSA